MVSFSNESDGHAMDAPLDQRVIPVYCSFSSFNLSASGISSSTGAFRSSLCNSTWWVSADHPDPPEREGGVPRQGKGSMSRKTRGVFHGIGGVKHSTWYVEIWLQLDH